VCSSDLRNVITSNPNPTDSNEDYIYIGQERAFDGVRLLKHGFGAILHLNNMFYIGEWDENMQSGVGILIVSNIGSSTIPNTNNSGTFYVGNWARNERSGNGAVYNRTGMQVYNGNFRNNRPTDQFPSAGLASRRFTVIQPTTNEFYIGEAEANTPHGTGIHISANGDIWFGPWRNGQRAGRGILILSHGSFDTGTWNGNTKTGD
jgi:hypothetical protein